MIGHFGHAFSDSIIEPLAHVISVFVRLIPGKTHSRDEKYFQDAMTAQLSERFYTPACRELCPLIRHTFDIASRLQTA